MGLSLRESLITAIYGLCFILKYSWTTQVWAHLYVHFFSKYTLVTLCPLVSHPWIQNAVFGPRLGIRGCGQPAVCCAPLCRRDSSLLDFDGGRGSETLWMKLTSGFKSAWVWALQPPRWSRSTVVGPSIWGNGKVCVRQLSHEFPAPPLSVLSLREQLAFPSVRA